MLHALFQTSSSAGGAALRRVVRHDAAGGRRTGDRRRCDRSDERAGRDDQAHDGRSSAPVGVGGSFRSPPNAAIKSGDGMALAYRAGAPLKDMEFVQYHPTGLPFTGILITEAAHWRVDT